MSHKFGSGAIQSGECSLKGNYRKNFFKNLECSLLRKNVWNFEIRKK